MIGRDRWIKPNDFASVMTLRAQLLSALPDSLRLPDVKPRMQTFTEDGTRVLFLDDVIDPIMGISARQIRADLQGHTGNLLMVINSEGGDVFESVAIADILANIDGRLTAHIAGIAASAASFLAMGAERISITPMSQMMIHRARTITIGDALRHQDKVDALTITDNAAATVYAQRSNNDFDTVLQMMTDETYLSAEQAVEQGFADEVLTEAYRLREDSQINKKEEEVSVDKINTDSDPDNEDKQIDTRRLDVAVAMKRFLQLKAADEL